LGTITSIGTYLPGWGTGSGRVTGLDEDVVTMGVAAGRNALGDVRPEEVERVVLVTRDFPLLVGGNAAPLLAGLNLPLAVEIREQLGGAPSALEAVASAEAGTLVIGADLQPAGAAAAWCGPSGTTLTLDARINRSLPVATRDDRGRTTDYADPRLLREEGLGVSLARAGVGKAVAVAGLRGKEAASLTVGAPAPLPTVGASSALLALALVGEGGDGGRVLAVEQATVVAAELAMGRVQVAREELAPLAPPSGTASPGAEIGISLAAYGRAFDVKLRLEAARCRSCGTLAVPPRHRCLGCGSEEETDTVALPREAEVYTTTTVHVPVPGLVTPYTLTLVELGASGVRMLVRLTDAPAGSVAIGDRGTMVFRLVAVRSGVPDYGYAFRPAARTIDRAA
jgi:uncharacterized OB-fold protein